MLVIPVLNKESFDLRKRSSELSSLLRPAKVSEHL